MLYEVKYRWGTASGRLHIEAEDEGQAIVFAEELLHDRGPGMGGGRRPKVRGFWVLGLVEEGVCYDRPPPGWAEV